MGHSGDDSNRDITRLLQLWGQGQQDAVNELLPMVYDHLRRIANRMMQNERRENTLSATALIHEAWLSLQDGAAPFADRGHFMAIASRQMRRILVDHARAKLTGKRGGDWDRITVTDVSGGEELVAIDLAFEKLAEFDGRKAQVADLILFGGLTADEAGRLLGISTPTVNRDWAFVRGFLQRELSR